MHIKQEKFNMIRMNIRPEFLFVAVSLLFTVNGFAETARPVSGTAVSAAGPLAVINGKPISIENFRTEMERQRGAFDANRKEELLDSIVRSELLFAAARSAGYESDPEVIAAVKQAMVGKYLRDNLDPKLAQLKATDQEAEAYYRSHQAEFGMPAMVHAAMIKIAVSQKISTQKKSELLKRAESARTEALALEKGVPAFGKVAVSYSEDQDSRYRGGDLGWLQAGKADGRIDKKVSDAIFALKTPGQVSQVITAPDGYYIVKLIEAKAATVKPFATVKDGVKYQVVQEKKKKIENELIAQLKSRIPVTVNRALLQTVSQSDEVKQAGPPALPKR